jgi:integrase
MASLKPPTITKLAQQRGRHHVGDGLYLVIKSNPGHGSWLFRYMRHDRAREMGLGPYPDCSLEGARKKLAAARALLHNDDVDPIDHRRTEKQKAMTFGECMRQYIADHEAGWRNEKHRWQWTHALEQYVLPTLDRVPVSEVDTAAVRRVLAPIWHEIPETAKRLRGRIEKILDWAKAMTLRSGDNPAAWRGNLQTLLPAKSRRKVTHYPALPYANLPEFMTDLRRRTGVSARALEFAVLTAARTGEVLGAEWGEIDLKRRVWMVPAHRMKALRDHRVHLCDRAIEILGEMRKLGHEGFVFPGTKRDKPLSNMVMLQLLRRMGRGDLTVHGFRSTFRDWCAEQTTHPSEVAEMALAHTVGDKVEAAYRRGDMFDRRRQLADEWAAFCANVTVPQVAA